MPAWTLMLLALVGCAASAPQVIRIPITPSCEPRNALEQCRVICLRDGKKAIQAVEDETQIGCNCGPWETLLKHPHWEAPGPRKLRKVPA